MKTNNEILVWNMGNVDVFYKKVKETEKTVWLQRIGTETKDSLRNDGHVWEVQPLVSEEYEEVFMKRKTKSGRVKMGQFQFLEDYDETQPVYERNF